MYSDTLHLLLQEEMYVSQRLFALQPKGVERSIFCYLLYTSVKIDIFCLLTFSQIVQSEIVGDPFRGS